MSAIFDVPAFIGGPRAGEPVPPWHDARVPFKAEDTESMAPDMANRIVTYTQHKIGAVGGERAASGYVLSSLTDDERTAAMFDALVGLAEKAAAT